MLTRRHVHVLTLVILLALASGCRRADTSGPRLQPTLTPTPRSTPLPALEPTQQPGTDGNPITIIVVDTAQSRRASSAADDLAETLSEAAELRLSIDLVSSTADAVAALCASFDGSPTVAWLDALGYAAARALDCGTPDLWIERGTGSDRSPSATLQFIVPSSSEITGPTGLVGVDLCRVGVTDYATWRAALLLMHANRLDPFTLGDVQDMEDVEAVIEAVADGTCSAVVDARDYDEYAVGALRTSIRVLNQDAQFPHLILMSPREIPLAARAALDQAFLDAEGDADLELLLSSDGLSQIDSDDLSAFDRLLEQTGLDFAQLGN